MSEAKIENVVAKFGGTSMGSAKAIAQVADILGKMPGAKTAVVSATSGTTDKLILLGETAATGGNWQEGIKVLVEKHEAILAELGVTVNLENLWKELKECCEEVQKKGELLTYM